MQESLCLNYEERLSYGTDQGIWLMKEIGKNKQVTHTSNKTTLRMFHDTNEYNTENFKRKSCCSKIKEIFSRIFSKKNV